VSTVDVAGVRQHAGRRILLRTLLASLFILAVIVATVVVVAGLFEQQYATYIYPGVAIGNFYVGEMTRAEAEAKVQEHYDRMLGVFEYKSSKWFAAWPVLGIRANAREAVQQAFNIGRYGSLDKRIAAWRARQPVVISFSYDATIARKSLEQRRAEVYVAPHSARVAIADGAAAVIPGVPGIELDADATLQDAYARLLKEQPVAVQTRPIAPADNGAQVASTQLNAWLQHPLTLTMWWASRMITRTITPVERTGWVALRNTGDRLSPTLNVLGMRDTLARVNAELGPDAAMRLDEATGMVQRAVEHGNSQVWFMVPHGEIRYTIKRGDTYESIGDTFSIPTARWLDANPNIWEEGGFEVGQQITIPTQSIMLPVLISPTNQQRIEVDLTQQRLQAFDGGKVVLSTSISSGIPKWRTLIGVFQVQEKVADAVNKLAHITMPDWLSIYDIGDPGNSLTNGIHALPELGGGRRLWTGYLGHPVSFGCVVMGIDEAAWLYNWVQLGTPVLIYGVTPPTDLNYDDLIEAQQKTQETP
jgi:hypothetical protein